MHDFPCIACVYPSFSQVRVEHQRGTLSARSSTEHETSSHTWSDGDLERDRFVAAVTRSVQPTAVLRPAATPRTGAGRRPVVGPERTHEATVGSKHAEAIEDLGDRRF